MRSSSLREITADLAQKGRITHPEQLALTSGSPAKSLSDPRTAYNLNACSSVRIMRDPEPFPIHSVSASDHAGPSLGPRPIVAITVITSVPIAVIAAVAITPLRFRRRGRSICLRNGKRERSEH